MTEESVLQFEGEMSLLTLTTREMCRIECGHAGIFLVDVESKSFPVVIKVVQKLESSRARRAQRRA